MMIQKTTFLMMTSLILKRNKETKSFENDRNDHHKNQLFEIKANI